MPPGDDPFELGRFLEAQQSCFLQVCAELRAGVKRTHWMWFIFPQLKGLGFSATAQRYGISGLAEACAYLAHPVLGGRLLTCTELTTALSPRPVESVFGYPDHLKFHSSMTLFARAAGSKDGPFRSALARYFAGAEDAATVRLLRPTDAAS
ncbi:MAG: DUF1810 domain-containing protein [Gammaproteobacteria bacterium]|nr:DUF1810 domain-containing protein [Gammaproteobacteria bacterium]MBV9695473.1 DUF1810 domain-containing protein [Gammaproteobacteria bacterium]